MSSRIRAVCFAGVFISCAAVLVAGCGSSDDKKPVHGGVGEAGASGATGEAGQGAGGSSPGAAGAAPTPEGGAGGEQSQPTAGEGGAPVGGAAGQGGAVGEGGAGGDGALACTPTGATKNVSLGAENSQIVCRGALVSTDFSATSAADLFTCCGVSDTVTPFAADLVGVVAGQEGLVYGSMVMLVPPDAPLGAASISATCLGGAVTNSFGIIVSATPVPVVTGLGSSNITSGSTLVIKGTHLDLVDGVTLVSVDGSNGSETCVVNPQTRTATSVSCQLPDVSAILPADYDVIVSQTDCGSAVNEPVVKIEAN